MTRYLLYISAIFITLPVAAPCAQSKSAPVKSTKPALSRAMIYATGEGAVANPKEQPNRAKAYLEAKSYAKMQAIASVVQEAKGTIIEYTSNGNNYLAETRVKQEIKGVLDSVQVVAVSKRSVDKDMIIAVTVRAPKPVPPRPINAIAKNDSCLAEYRSCTPTWLSNTKTARTPKKSDDYTSVVIDTQGLGVSRSMSPKIVRSDGSEVWGTLKSDYEFISEYGIVAYANNRAEAYASKRAGDHPLLIRAIGVGPSPSNGDVVISPHDARSIEEANQKSGFLEDFRVIIIVDSVRNIRSFAARR